MSDDPREHSDRDERVSIPLDPEDALRGLLGTPPEPEPAKPKRGERFVSRTGDSVPVRPGQKPQRQPRKD